MSATRLYHEKKDTIVAELWEWRAPDTDAAGHYVLQWRQRTPGIEVWPRDWHTEMIHADTDAIAIRKVIERIDAGMTL